MSVMLNWFSTFLIASISNYHYQKVGVKKSIMMFFFTICSLIISVLVTLKELFAS
jgi:hypothetical protein